MRYQANLILLGLFLMAPGLFAATLTFSTSAPAATTNAISNFVGATFDADNVGGSGVNANGGANNGAANDNTTYVATNRPAQGQTFTTGSNAGGYTITAITVRIAGYTNNIASGSNNTYWSLANTPSTFYVRIGRLNGTTFIPYTIEYATSGGTGNPGVGNSANGSGVYLTFTLKAPFVLQPNTVYAFDIGTTGDIFEMLGIRDGTSGGNPYAGGTAYTSGTNGVAAGTIATQTGDRDFQVNLTAYTAPAPGTFVHPGLLNTQADFDRMRTNVAMGIEPWASGYSALTASWLGHQLSNWNPNPQSTITRGGSGTQNYSVLYNDIAVAYGCALRWKISGDTAYADEAVRILNAWGYKLTTLAGDTNIALIELYGYQFACVAEIMRTYSGWAPADIAQFQTMIYNVFYPLANSFLNGHFGTAYDHYWANWDLASMNTMYAIGVFCDNPALTNQALTYFYNGVGNGCLDRTANFIHPGFLGQGQEAGRDQGHASLDIAELAPLCQMAWNQGVDLYGYENNRVLSVAEYTAKYNLFYDVPFTPYWNSISGLMSGSANGSRGAISRPGWATLYNHYVNLKGLAAPYTKTVVNQDGTGYGTGYTFNGDEPEWDYLTSALPPIATGANPSGLTAIVTAQQPVLSWWGSAYATSYNVLRSTTSGGPYTTIASGITTNTYTDTSVVPGTTYYYVVKGTLASGTTGNSNEAQAILGTPVYAQLLFNETSGTNAADATGNGWNGTLMNGATWTAGKSGNAVNLAKASSQYVSIPAGVVANLSDFSISAWVYQTSITTQARVFDFGSGDGMYGGVDVWGNTHWLAERYMYLTTQSGNGKVRFGISRSASGGEEGVDGTSPLPTGQWTHVCVTKSGNVATLYVNGIAVGQNLNVPMMPLQLPPTTSNYIGRSQWRGDPYFDGKIDDFRIYRGPLSTGAVYTLATGLQPPAPPSPPANLTITAQAGGQNALSWTASAGATSYTVLRATSSGGPYSIIATLVSGTNYTDTGLAAGTTYYYKIDAANAGGDGAASAASSGVVALPPIPSVPTNVKAVATSSTANTITWSAAANAYSYSVKRSLTSGGPYTTIASGLTIGTYTDSGLTTGTTYYYVVSSVNTAGEGANSAQDSATPSDLLVHLRFDEGVGTITYDASGNGWDTWFANAPAWVPGIFGNAIQFTSGSSQYGVLPTGLVSTVNDFTISVWVKMTSLATWARIYDFGTGTTNNMYLTAQGPAGAGKPHFGIHTPSVAEQGIDSSIAIPTGSWTQIVVTLSGSTGRMYISGTLAGTNSAMTLTPASLGSTTLNYLGRSQFSADPYLNASIDDLRINGHAFTAAEVAAIASPSPTAPTGLTANPGDGQISLDWAVNETATTYNVKRATVSGGPYTTVASGLATPAFVDTGLTDDTTYYYVVSAVNWLGESANSTETASAPYAIAWTSGDIGSVSAAGSSSVSGQTFTVIGSGADVSGTADAFQFCAVPLTGDCMITARVTSVQNTNAWAKAGVMIRGSLAANSMNAALFVTPTTTNGVSWQSRLADGATTTNIGATGITAPYWVSLVRTGTTIQGYRSSDGVNWTSAGSATLSSLGSSAYVGLAVTSHVNGTTCTATFDNVTVNWLPTTPADLTATPDSSQVALNWSTAPNAASYNVKRATVSGGPYTTIATPPGTSYTDTTAVNGTAYYYVVSASNIMGESANSAEAGAIPSAPIGGSETFAPALAARGSGSGANTNLAFTIRSSVVGHTYQLQYSNNLVSNSWTNIGSPQLGTGTDLILNITVNPSSAPSGFYRILIRQ